MIKITALVFINLITPKARAKQEPLFNEPASDIYQRWVCWTFKLDLAQTQQSVIKITALVFINLVTPKARAKQEPLFNEPASDIYQRWVCWTFKLDLAQTQQSVIKITALVFINLVTPKARAKHEPLFNNPASDIYVVNEPKVGCHVVNELEIL